LLFIFYSRRLTGGRGGVIGGGEPLKNASSSAREITRKSKMLESHSNQISESAADWGRGGTDESETKKLYMQGEKLTHEAGDSQKDGCKDLSAPQKKARSNRKKEMICTGCEGSPIPMIRVNSHGLKKETNGVKAARAR